MHNDVLSFMVTRIEQGENLLDAIKAAEQQFQLSTKDIYRAMNQYERRIM